MFMPDALSIFRTPPTPDYADLDNPPKKRIALAARRVFMMYGVYMPLRAITELAQTNEATAIRYFESQSGLVHSYVQDLIKDLETFWKEAEAEYPTDSEAQLRSWLHGLGLRSVDAFDEASQLARVEAQLFRWDASPLLTQVRSVRMKELNRIIRLCEKASFDEPSLLAHKLMLLVDGARSNSNCYEFGGPHSHLLEAASDLMAVHRGGAKLISPLD